MSVHHFPDDNSASTPDFDDTEDDVSWIKVGGILLGCIAFGVIPWVTGVIELYERFFT